jgi:molybdopterin synthase catalytic subunit
VTAFSVRVQRDPFDAGDEWRTLLARLDGNSGAVASFVGLVREVAGDGGDLLELEHYPGMTERSIERIVERACERFALHGGLVVHRVGALAPREPIVLVLAAAGHRAEAFAACEYIMDYLKTDAVFWKKETGAGGTRWVEATAQDRERQGSWQ